MLSQSFGHDSSRITIVESAICVHPRSSAAHLGPEGQRQTGAAVLRGNPCNPGLLRGPRRGPRPRSSAVGGQLRWRQRSVVPLSLSRACERDAPTPWPFAAFPPVHCGRHTGAQRSGSSRDQRPRGRRTGDRTRRTASRRRPAVRRSIDDATAADDAFLTSCKPRTTMTNSERITATQATRRARPMARKQRTRRRNDTRLAHASSALALEGTRADETTARPVRPARASDASCEMPWRAGRHARRRAASPPRRARRGR